MSETASDPFTMWDRLCDDDGMVTAKYLDHINHLRELTNTLRGDEHCKPVTEAFVCTGHAHLAGEHIRCSTPIHKRVLSPQELAARDSRIQGLRLLRVARELREFVADAEDVPASLITDIETVDRVGHCLESAKPIRAYAGVITLDPVPGLTPAAGVLTGEC